MEIFVTVTYNFRDHDPNFDEVIESHVPQLEFDGRDMMLGAIPTRSLFFFAESREIAEQAAIDIARLGKNITITIDDLDEDEDE